MVRTDPNNYINTSSAFIIQTSGFKTLVLAYSDYQPIWKPTISAPTDPRTDRDKHSKLTQLFATARSKNPKAIRHWRRCANAH
jgi:hypothetical protein